VVYFAAPSSGGSRICERGGKAERRRREYRGVEGAEGVGYIHTYISVICIAHINSKESLCASVAKQVSFQRLFESVK